MTSEQERPIGKISYEKPTAVDLGPTAPVVGASCVEGGKVSIAECDVVGNSAGDYCSETGNSAGGDGCGGGNSADGSCNFGDGGPGSDG